MDSDRAFEAPDLIEVMEEAVRYNRFLIGALATWARDTDSLLDFGAGNGRFAEALRERHVDVHAIEPDRMLRKKIEAKGVAAYENLEVLGERRFGGLYTVNVLEHLEDDEGALRAFYRSLRIGGKLFIYVPAFEVIFSANDERVGHLRRYRLRSLTEKVEAAGFTVDRASYVDCLGFFAAFAYRFIGNADGGLDVWTVKFYDRFIFPLSRALDSIFGRLFGKNLLLLAEKKSPAEPPG